MDLALKGSVVLGLLGMALFNEAPWGLNVLIWLLALIVITGWTAVKVGSSLKRIDLFWMASACLGAAGLVYRMSPTLSFLNVMVIVVSLIMVGLSRVDTSGGNIFLGGIWCHFLNGIGHLSMGALKLLFRNTKWFLGTEGKQISRSQVVMRGMLIAAPFILIFCFLFARADQAFSSLLAQAFDLIFERIWSLLICFVLSTWLAGGLLRNYLVDEPVLSKPPKISTGGLGSSEINLALGLINILFIFFVTVQLRYLFGGANLIELDPNLTYATYARQGFFELVFVATLVLPMLLVMDWIIAPSASKRIFRIFCILLLALLMVVMLSALQRMQLYQAEYGQTELRFYVVAFIAWLAVICFWFAASVLRGRAQRFSLGVVLVSIATVVVLNLLNPDQIILRINIHRVADGKNFDVSYANTLSLDAVPELMRSKGQLASYDARSLALDFAEDDMDQVDARSWNYSRWSARKLLNIYFAP